MLVSKLHPFGRSLSRPHRHPRRVRAFPGPGPRPHVERLEDRTLLSAAGQALVAQMYQDLLQRPADTGGLANWSAALDQGASPAQVALDLAQSPEGRVLQVQSLYQQFLHRPADQAGLAGFTQTLVAGQTLEQVAAVMVASPEYYQNQGGTDSAFLDAIYQDALDRQIDAGGAASFGQGLAGGSTRLQVAEAIFGSAELQHDIVQHDYQYFLHRVADGAGLANWTQALQHGMRDEQIAAAIVGSTEYAQTVQSAGGSLQQTLLPNDGQVDPVLVTNTPSQPLPINGSVGVDGPVPVLQTGAWMVGITGTPNVHVVSSPNNPVLVQNVGVQSFSKQLELTWNYTDFGTNRLTFTVPAGEQLVIENVSGEAFLPSGQHPLFFVDAVHNSFADQHVSPTLFQGSMPSLGEDIYAANDSVKYYFDAGVTMFVYALRDQTPGDASGFITVEGYLVNQS